jgi:hypothetical protein
MARVRLACPALVMMRSRSRPTQLSRRHRNPHRTSNGRIRCPACLPAGSLLVSPKQTWQSEQAFRVKRFSASSNGRPATAESVARLAGALMVAIRVLTSDSEFDHLVTVRFRTCTECHALKRLTAFVPIKGCRGHYGRCRACRAAAAKQRYHSSEQVRIAEIERARRNRRRGSSAAA